MSALRSSKSSPVIPWFTQGLSLLLLHSTWAASGLWIGSEGQQAWNESANWENGNLPGAPSTLNNQDTATFGSNLSSATVLTPHQWNLKSLIFTPSSGSFVFGSSEPSDLRLSSGGSIELQSGFLGSSVEFKQRLLLQGNYTFRNLSRDQASFVNPPRLIFSGNITNETTGQITLNLAGTVGSRARSESEANVISGVISDGTAGGKTSVSVSGTNAERGAWYLSGLNTFTGDFIANSGTTFHNTLANKGVASSFGAGNTIRTSGGAALYYTGVAAASTNRDIITTGLTWYNKGGTVTVDSTATITGTTGNLTFRGQKDFIIDAKITGNLGVTRTDNGVVYLNHLLNDFTGNISISQGSFVAKSIANSGVASAIGAGNQIILGQINGGTSASGNTGRIAFNSDTDLSTNRSIRITNGLSGSTPVGGGIIENLTAHTVLTLNGNITASNTSTASTLEVSGGGNGRINSILAGSANMQLTKSGTGTWDLTGANTHVGGTVVSAGTLLVNNTAGSATGTGSVNVTGTSTLGGTGFIRPTAVGAELSVMTTAKLMIGNTHSQLAGATNGLGHTAQGSLLTIGNTSNVALDLAGTIQFDIFGHDAGITHSEADRLAIQTQHETLNFGGKIEIANSTGAKYQIGQADWQILDWSGVNFENTQIQGTPTLQLANDLLRIGYVWDTSELLSTGTLRSVADATTYIWTGMNTTDNRWNDLSNWEGGVVPTRDNSVVFGAISNSSSGVVTTNMGADRYIKNMLFTGEREYEIATTTGVLYIAGEMVHSMGGNQRITTQFRTDVNGDITFLSDQNTLNMNVIMTGASRTNNLIFDGAGNIALNSIARRGNTVVNVVKNGTGTLTIASYNNRTGSEEGGITANGAQIKGKFTINEGEVRIQNQLSLGAAADSFTSDQLTLNGGRLVGYGGEVVISDANRGITVGSRGGSFGAANGASLVLGQVVHGTGSVGITGPGEVHLTQANLYAGLTTVTSNAKLWVTNSTGSATGTGSVLLQNGALLRGSGFISPNSGNSITAQAGSQIVVGASSQFASSLTLGATSSPLNINITLAGVLGLDLLGAGQFADFGDASYLSHDTNLVDMLLLSTTGNIDLRGLTLILDENSTDTWSLGQRWKLIDWSQGSANLVQTDGLGLSRSQYGDFQLDTFTNADGLYVYVIPEPSKSLLILLGAACFALRRRKA